MTAFGEAQFKRSLEMTPQQEAVARSPEKPKKPIELWAEQARNLINQIDGNYQLQETLPGLRFAEDLAQLLDESTTGSRSEFSHLLDSLYQDLQDHEFMIHFETGNIHMANETAPMELGKLFALFSEQLAQLPVPGFDKDLAEKRNRLVKAFKDRSSQLGG